MIKQPQARWGACSRTVLPGSTPYTLACWNNLIAAGLLSGKIITLDATTGICTSKLSVDSVCVRSLAFSSDGMSLVSGSDNGIVRLWDIQTGGVVRIFDGHHTIVWSVSISPDQTTIASGSGEYTIHLHNAQTGECCCVIRHNNIVNTVSFSPTNSQLLISASHDTTVQQWDINGHKIGPAYTGSYAVFSPDGTHFISWIGVITVRNSSSGVVITQLQTPSSRVNCCCFSPNGKFVAGANGNIIYIWDITNSNAHPIKTLVGHTSGVNIFFHPHLIIH